MHINFNYEKLSIDVTGPRVQLLAKSRGESSYPHPLKWAMCPLTGGHTGIWCVLSSFCGFHVNADY